VTALIWNLCIVAVLLVFIFIIEMLDVAYAVILWVPTVMFVFGNILVYKVSKTEMPSDNSMQYFTNPGYKTGGSMRSQVTWEFANAYFGKLYIRLSFLAVGFGVLLSFFLNDTLEICMLPQIILAILPIFITENEIDKQFDRTGNRKENNTERQNTPGYVIKTKEDDTFVQKRAKIRAEIEQNIVPCAKTKEEFRCFLVDTLGMKETPISESERTEAKAQFILELRRDLLPTQGNGNPDNPMAQFLEARKVPLEQTGFEITKYAMEYYVDDYKLSDVTVFLEENSFTYYASGESYVRNDEDDRIARHLYDNIALFRGVTAEDIDTKSEWYNIYVSLLTGHALEEAK